MRRPLHCPGCGARLDTDLGAKVLLWRVTGFTALLPTRCASCALDLMIEQVYADGDQLRSWSVRAQPG